MVTVFVSRLGILLLYVTPRRRKIRGTDGRGGPRAAARASLIVTKWRPRVRTQGAGRARSLRGKARRGVRARVWVVWGAAVWEVPRARQRLGPDRGSGAGGGVTRTKSGEERRVLRDAHRAVRLDAAVGDALHGNGDVRLDHREQLPGG